MATKNTDAKVNVDQISAPVASGFVAGAGTDDDVQPAVGVDLVTELPVRAQASAVKASTLTRSAAAKLSHPRQSSTTSVVPPGLSRRLSNASSIFTGSPPPSKQSLPSISDLRPPEPPEKNAGVLETILTETLKGRFGTDLKAIIRTVKDKLGDTDDRKLGFEQSVEMIQGFPDNLPQRTDLGNLTIKTLWNDLDHPPNELRGMKHRFRTADGSGNNTYIPSIGQAGQPYARSVAPERPFLNQFWPDPEAVFDLVLRKKKDAEGNEDFVPHPSGISSFLFAQANLIIHDLFHTDRDDPNINKNSSYLDLAPLYGSSVAEQKSVRTGKDGLLWPDAIADRRIMLMPPSTAALVILYSRNHNYIAKKLLEINERGTWKKRGQWDSDAQRDNQDEEIFQTARLINCGVYMEVILHDYLKSILGIVNEPTHWYLDPRDEIDNLGGSPVEKGKGNVCSVEFNLVYRWHTTPSEHDTTWLRSLLDKTFSSPPFNLTPADVPNLTIEQFYQGAGMLAGKVSRGEPRTWGLGEWKREQDGKFSDELLGKIVTDAIEGVAGAYRARGVSEVLRPVEVAGIRMAREKWGVCTLNEFRKFLNLKAFETFDEFNDDPEIAAAMESLYGHPDNIELHVGLMAEQPKPSVVGSGLCPGYTISRGILSDAVALVRGDRFFTTTFNADSLTSWGLAECKSHTDDSARGSIMHRLLQRHLPETFGPDSIHASVPFQTPDSIKARRAVPAPSLLGRALETISGGKGGVIGRTINGVLDEVGSVTGLGKLSSGPGDASTWVERGERYTWERPEVERETGKGRKWVQVGDEKEIEEVLGNSGDFGPAYNGRMTTILTGDFAASRPSLDPDLSNHDPSVGWGFDALFPEDAAPRLEAFYGACLNNVIHLQSVSLTKGRTWSLNLLDGALDCASTAWIAHEFGIPYSSDDKSHWSLRSLRSDLNTIADYVFFNTDPIKEYGLRDRAIEKTKFFTTLIEGKLKSASKWRRETVYDRIMAGEKDRRVTTDLVHKTFKLLLAASANQGEAAALAVVGTLKDSELTSRLGELCAGELDDVREVLKLQAAEAAARFPHYPGLARLAKRDTKVNGVEVKKNWTVWLDLEKVSVSTHKLVAQSDFFSSIRAQMAEIAQPVLLHRLFNLPNLHVAAGPAGSFHTLRADRGEVRLFVTRGGWSGREAEEAGWSTWPNSLVVQYEGR